MRSVRWRERCRRPRPVRRGADLRPRPPPPAASGAGAAHVAADRRLRARRRLRPAPVRAGVRRGSASRAHRRVPGRHASGGERGAWPVDAVRLRTGGQPGLPADARGGSDRRGRVAERRARRPARRGGARVQRGGRPAPCDARPRVGVLRVRRPRRRDRVAAGRRRRTGRLRRRGRAPWRRPAGDLRHRSPGPDDLPPRVGSVPVPRNGVRRGRGTRGGGGNEGERPAAARHR